MASSCLIKMAQFYMKEEILVLKSCRIYLLKQSYKETKELLASKVENMIKQDIMTFNLL
jgi:hypothetical protein